MKRGPVKALLARETTPSPALRRQVQQAVGGPGQALPADLQRFAGARLGALGPHRPLPQAAAKPTHWTVGGVEDAAEAEAEQVAQAPAAPGPAFDLSGVRVHTDARSTAALGARAFTLGNHVVFAPGQWQPSQTEGRRLALHELAHVAQNAQSAPVLRRSAWGFLSNLWQLLPGTGFADETLQAYLDGPPKEGRVEDDWDSDDKALAVVERWRAGGRGNAVKIGARSFPLTPALRAALAAELRSTYTRDVEAKAAAEITAAPPSAETAKTGATAGPMPEAAPTGPTASERKAQAIREGLRGQVETRQRGGRTYRIGGLRANPAAQREIPTLDILLPREDASHLAFFDGRLGMDVAHTTPRDPVRWQQLGQMLAEAKVEMFAVGADTTFQAKQINRRGPATVIDPTLSIFGGQGVTLIREELSNALGPLGPTEHNRLLSLTDADQVYYRTGNVALGHELFGHIWLALHGVPFGHGSELAGTTTIHDPFGAPYQGSVDNYIESFVQKAGRPSATAGKTPESLQASLDRFLRAAREPHAFVVTRMTTGWSPALREAWRDLRADLELRLANPRGQAQRLDEVAAALRALRDGLSADFREAFDRYYFGRSGTGTGKQDPEQFVVQALKIPNPLNAR